MSKVTSDANIDRGKSPEEQAKFISIFLDQVQRLLNNGLKFADNFDAKIVSVTFPTASTDVKVDHNLGRVPSGYVITKKSASMIVYDGATSWTSTSIYLRASAIGTATILIY